MQRNHLALFAAAGLACGAMAQTPINQWGQYPDVTTFASRVFVPGSDAADVMVHVNSNLVQGVGTISGVSAGGRVNAMRGVVQDSDRSTGEHYGFCILPDDPANPGQPDPNTDLLRLTPFTTPGSGTGGVAWIVTVTLNTPADVLPLQSDYHIGMELAPSPEASMWTAYYFSGPEGDNPKPNAPTVTNAINRTTGNLTTPSPRTMRVHLLTEAATLEAGADIDPNMQRGPNPSFGMAGQYPDRTRQDGIAFRIRDEASANQPYGVFVSGLGFNQTPITMPVLEGSIYPALPLFPIAFATGNLDNDGLAEVISLVPYPAAGAKFMHLTYQAVILTAQGTGRLTNGAGADDS